MSDQKFKVGDIVEAFGVTGKVVHKTVRENDIKVEFEGGYEDWFEDDGKHERWHKEPSLKLIERKKEPFRWEGKVRWDEDRYGEVKPYGLIESSKFVGKKGTLTFVEDEK